LVTIHQKKLRSLKKVTRTTVDVQKTRRYCVRCLAPAFSGKVPGIYECERTLCWIVTIPLQ